MARPTVTEATERKGAARKRRRTARLPAGVTLALWRGRRMWRLLLVAELGVVAAVLLVCAVPLFSQVTMTAGLEHTLANSPIPLNIDGVVETNAPSRVLYQQVEQRLNTIIRTNLRVLHVGTPTFQITSQPLAFPHANGGQYDGLAVEGFLDSYLGTQISVIQGRLPQTTPDALEMVMTRKTADALGLTIGSTLLLGSADAPNPIVLRLVGIIVSTNATPGNDFQPHAMNVPGQPYGPGASANTGYTAAVSANAIFNAPYDWSALSLAQTPGHGGYGPDMWSLDWTYAPDLSHLGPGDLNALIDDPQAVQQHLFSALDGIPNTQNGFVETYLFQLLIQYKSRVVGGAVFVSILLLDVLGLVLLFLGVMTNVLVDRQAAIIATLRSRGASQRQIFATFALQSLGIGIIATIVGPLLAIPLVRLVAGTLLPSSDQAALSVVGGNPLAIAAGVGWYAGSMALVAWLAMIWSLRKAAGLNVLALRQEHTREVRKPLWQRLYLDVLAAILALAGYGAFALVNALTASEPAQTQGNISGALSPLVLVAPIFLMVAAALLFLRFFPVLLRLGERLTARGRGATTMLALTQVARASRQASRTTLLLALTTCFALVTLTANATLAQRIRDVAAFQAGADISGGVTPTGDASAANLAQQTAAYDAIPGMRAATLGYRVSTPLTRGSGSAVGFPATAFGPAGPNQGSLQIEAVDADTFANSGYWDTQDAAQSLADLMAMLRAHRTDATAHDVVYAVVDAVVWSELRLHQGATFTLPVPGYTQGGMRFVAAMEAAHIPTMFGDQGGGILVDYQSYATVYAADTGDATGEALAPNFIWLRTKDDATSLASVRAAIANGPLQVSTWIQADGPLVRMADRRIIIAELETDPLKIDMTGILGIGGAAALLLALFGTLIAAWLRVRNQLSTYALLRALGTEPRRLASLLFWEQGIVYVVALGLGVALGMVLSIVMLPALPDLALSSAFGGPVDASGPPVRVVLPWLALALALAGLIVICGSAVLLSARVASRPSLSQTLRLNEE
ncbi:MAG TPA: FtsX-like permease family protein [Ktedonobacterales bacterium]|nr:FtsX-like permease family protein [Ktedonobacterales bacterium]